MNTTMKNLVTAAAAVIAIGSSIPEAQATKVRFKGSGDYDLGSRVTYYAGGRPQSGRYTNLGADYYHTTEIDVDQIVNRGTVRSGSLSFEFWAMPFYGATSGVVLMTTGLDPLKPGFHFSNVTHVGKAISLDRRRFPELELFEYTGTGWRSRDFLTFSNKDLL